MTSLNKMLFYVNERLRNPCIIPKKERVYVIQMPRERHECTFIMKNGKYYNSGIELYFEVNFLYFEIVTQV